MKLRFFLTSVLLVSMAPSGASAQGPVLPQLTLVLTPHQSADSVDSLRGVMTITGPALRQGDELVQMGLTVASIPTARYDGSALKAEDADGPLPLSIEDGKPGPFGTTRRWIVSRPSHGPIVLRFSAQPRVVDAHTRPGPLFDLRSEAGGVNGAGLTFLPTPTGGPFNVALRWDLSGMPLHTMAASTFGEGDVSFTGPPGKLAGAFYMVGPIHAAPKSTEERKQFASYWLTPTPFDVVTVGALIQKLYVYEASFFHDQGGGFRVFVRHNPYPSGGGTAQGRSFMFGWNEAHIQSPESLEDVLAHEMTHTWPILEGDHADTSWYSEGNAEYYSILSSWRAGLITDNQFLARVNGRSLAYYINPLQRVSNSEAEQMYWKDINASHVPYGRGFMYLATVDAQIRAKSSNRRSLDNVVVALSRRHQAGEGVGVNDWLIAVERELGPSARSDYEAMVSGRPIVPVDGGFGPCFRLQSFNAHRFALGFEAESLSGANPVIKGLVPGSNAAKAGLLDGDRVVASSSLDEAARTGKMSVTIERDGNTRTIAYAATDKPVLAYRWVQRRPQPTGSCIQSPTVQIN